MGDVSFTRAEAELSDGIARLAEAQDEKPFAIVNSGPTRGDHVAAVRIEAALGEALQRLAAALGAP